MESIIIYLTYKCNLNCDYCFIKQTDSTITKDTFEKIIKWFISEEGETKKISLLGGEPLLCMDLLRHIGEMLASMEKFGKKVELKAIPTNGILLDGKMLQELKKLNLKLSFSLDGGITSHSRHRNKNEGEFHRIFHNILLYKKNYCLPDVKITVHPDQAENLYKNVRWLFEQGLTRMLIAPAFGQVWKKPQIDSLQKNFQQVISYYFRKKIKNPKDVIIQPIDENIKRLLDKQFFKNPNCGLGSEIVFTPEGEAYACTLVMHIHDKEFVEKFRLGHIDDDIDLNKMRAFQYYKICEDVQVDCKYKFPVVTCNKICTCLDFQENKLFDRENASAMVETENMMFHVVYDFFKSKKKYEVFLRRLFG